jgi:hypothetical protein
MLARKYIERIINLYPMLHDLDYHMFRFHRVGCEVLGPRLK